MKRTDKNNYKLKGEAYWLHFAMVKELMHIDFSIVELAHLPLPHPTAFVFRVAIKAKNPNSQPQNQRDKQYSKSDHPP